MIKLKLNFIVVDISLIFSQEIEQDAHVHVDHQIEDIEELIDPNNYRN